VVPYRPEHAPLVAALQRHLWSHDVELNAAYLDWKHHQNPYIREPLIYLAFVDEQLVGMRGIFGTRWEVGEPSESFTLPYADDLVIDPAFRRRGVHQQIMRFALDDLDRRGYRYLINLSAGPVTQRTSVLMHWRNAGRVMHVQRRAMRRTMMDSLASRASKLPIVWRLSEGLQRLGGPMGDRLFDRFDSRSARRTRQRQSGAIFADVAPLPEEMESLVNRLPSDGRLRHVRDHT
jgi:GNAT superfamily N-acetyltransferase